MIWLLPRVLVAVLAMGLGAAAGWLAGQFAGPGTDAPAAGALLGSATGAIGAALLDAWRGWRLVVWLRGAQEQSAPRDAGFWGEVAYRVERALRRREQATARAEQRLAEFRSAIEASPNGVLILDGGEHIEWCNAVGADHFGLDPVRDIAQRVTNLIRAPAFVEYLQRGVWSEPVRVPSPQRGGMLSVMVRPYGEGHKLVLSQDVTETERADAMRRDFVANVSHEIRTPLTVLTSAVESLRTLPLADDERRRLFDLTARQAERMEALVADLLTLASLEASPRPAPDRWVGIGPLMDRIEADTRALSGGRHRLSFAGDRALQVAGSERELHSAVANLVSNAVRYTPEGGSVEVRWRVCGNGSAEVSVTDSGIGIAREHLPRLAQRFYRVDGSRSRETGGTGLGLSIVKHVMQRHGGELDLRSEVGRGSTFRLVFPPARVRAAPDAGEAAPPRGDGDGAVRSAAAPPRPSRAA